MRVCATSDLHGDLPEIPECDLLLIAGDVCPWKNSHAVTGQRHWLRKKFFPWMEGQPAKEIVWIGGNHDFVCEQPGFYRIADEGPANSIYLHDVTTVVNGLSIYGSPWTPNLRTWAFFKDTPDFQTFADQLPKADIYLLHAPPAGILDGGHPEWGSPFVAGAIARHHPKLVIFGHIHKGYGKASFGDLTFANVAHMNELYEPVNAPMLFDV